MTNLELKNRLALISHRSDLAGQMQYFIDAATEKINRRFSLSLAYLVNDSDTNDVLAKFPLLYIYPALESLYEFLNNGDNAIYYNNQWEREASRQNITAASPATDAYATSPPVITTEV